MRDLRLFAAQSEAKNRIIKASLGGGAALFCLSLAATAHADSTSSSLSDSSSNVSSTPAPAPTPDPSSSTPLAAEVGLSDSSTVQSLQPQVQAPVSEPSEISIPLVSSKIDTATATVQTAIANSTATLQAIPDVQAKVAALPLAQAAVETATAAIQDVTSKIQIAQQTLETATVSAAVVPVAQAGVDAATATVAAKTLDLSAAQSGVDTATANVAFTNAALTDLQNAQPALDAAAACTDGSACVHFYTANAELGPLNDQIAAAQQANSDAYWSGVAWVHAVMEPDRATYTAAVVASDAAHADAVAAVPLVVSATDAANTAQDAATQAQAAADASAVTTTTNGVTATVYRAANGAAPALPAANAVPVETIKLSNIAANWGSGQILNSGLSDHVIVKYEGTITVPDEAVAVKYAVSSDDGSKMYIDGQLAINNWRDQGTTWSPYSPTYNTTTDKQQDFVIWYYENGGGASCTLGWMIFRADGTGYFTTPGASAFGTTTITNDPALVAAALAAKAASLQAATDLANAQANLDAATAADAKAWADRGAAYQKLVEDYTHLSEIENARPALAQAITDAQAAYDAKLTERNAAWDAYTAAVHAASDNASAIPVAQAAYDKAIQDLTDAEQNLTVVAQDRAQAQQNLTVQQAVLDLAQNTATRDALAANAAADVAVQAANTAASVLAQSTQTIQNEIAKKAAEDAAAAKAAADAAAAQELAAIQAAARATLPAPSAPSAPAPDPLPLPTPTPQAPEPAPAVDATPNPEPAPAPAAPAPDAAPAPAAPSPDTSPKTPEPAPAPDKPVPSTPTAPAPDKPTPPAPVPATPEKPAPQPQPAPTPPVVAPSQPPAVVNITPNTTAQTYVPAVAPEKYLAPAQIEAYKAIGVVPNNPAQLPTDVPKPAPVEALVPHVQVDVKGVENGGIQLFGTQTAPQVVQEDGKLTPPAPAPGSGLPIPADAITIAATFIGQPGGTTFNAPDVAVPVIETPVTGAIAAVPGVQALNHAFVAMSNIGNDMSPVTRKKAKKILVLTVAVAAVVRRKFGR